MCVHVVGVHCAASTPGAYTCTFATIPLTATLSVGLVPTAAETYVIRVKDASVMPNLLEVSLNADMCSPNSAAAMPRPYWLPTNADRCKRIELHWLIPQMIH